VHVGRAANFYLHEIFHVADHRPLEGYRAATLGGSKAAVRVNCGAPGIGLALTEHGVTPDADTGKKQGKNASMATWRNEECGEEIGTHGGTGYFCIAAKQIQARLPIWRYVGRRGLRPFFLLTGSPRCDRPIRQSNTCD